MTTRPLQPPFSTDKIRLKVLMYRQDVATYDALTHDHQHARILHFLEQARLLFAAVMRCHDVGGVAELRGPGYAAEPLDPEAILYDPRLMPAHYYECETAAVMLHQPTLRRMADYFGHLGLPEYPTTIDAMRSQSLTLMTFYLRTLHKCRQKKAGVCIAYPAGEVVEIQAPEHLCQGVFQPTATERGKLVSEPMNWAAMLRPAHRGSRMLLR